MAETSSPASVLDWTEDDRISCRARWNDANCMNLMMPSSGFNQYKTIRQRAYFYDWFDQIRDIQGHEVLWPAAAWIVATQMSNVENPIKNIVISKDMGPLAQEGNKAIFDNVFPKLAQVYKDGLAGRPLKGEAATKWDAATLKEEQFTIVQPIYDRHIAAHPDLKDELADLSGGKGIYWLGGAAIGSALNFKGDITKAQDRFDHGANVVTKFYKSFKAAVDSSRKKTNVTTPDPSAHGHVKITKP